MGNTERNSGELRGTNKGLSLSSILNGVNMYRTPAVLSGHCDTLEKNTGKVLDSSDCSTPPESMV